VSLPANKSQYRHIPIEGLNGKTLSDWLKAGAEVAFILAWIAWRTTRDLNRTGKYSNKPRQGP